MRTAKGFAAMSVLAIGLAGLAMPATAADPDAPARVADSEQDGYVDKARREMAEWKRKVAAFGRDVKREGREMKKEAAEKLAGAWDEVDENWQELKRAGRKAGDESWDRAKDAYEASKRKLQETWNDVAS